MLESSTAAVRSIAALAGCLREVQGIANGAMDAASGATEDPAFAVSEIGRHFSIVDRFRISVQRPNECNGSELNLRCPWAAILLSRPCRGVCIRRIAISN